MFAVIRTGGKQYRVAADDKITVMSLAGEPGDKVTFDDVLMSAKDGAAEFGAKVKVTGEIVEQARGPKVISFKKRRRKNSKRKRGYRDEITVIRVTEILTNGKAPSVGPRPKKEKKVEAPSAEGDAPAKAAKKAPAKKAAPKAAAKAPAKKAAPKAKADKK